jgi:rubrerythrin
MKVQFQEDTMGKLFYLHEIFNFAVEREEDAIRFYKDFGDRTDDPEMKELFMTLVREESRHREFFLGQSETVSKKQSPGVSEDDEYALYIKEMISSDREKSADPSGLDPSDRKAVLDFGIEREKDSILFYHGLKTFVEKDALPALDKIIQEEGRHITLLSGMRKG